MKKFFKLPKLTKDQRKYLARLQESERNPDLTLQFGPGSNNARTGNSKRIVKKQKPSR